MAVIVMTHGLFSDSSFDVAQAEALEAAGHRVVQVDLIGHGRHPRKPHDPGAYTFAALADDVAAAADRVSPDAPVVALGGSLGSAASLAFARRHPRRCAALVLLQPAFLYGPRTELVDVARLGRARGLVGLWRRVTGDEASVRRLEAQDLDAMLAAAEGLGRDRLLAGPDDLAATTQPALIVAVPGDKLHPMEVATAYWRHIPTSRLLSETPGDVPLWDRPDDLAAAVTRFLGEVGSSLRSAAMGEVGRGQRVFAHPPVRGRFTVLDGPDDVLSLMDRGAGGVVALVREAGATFLAPIYHELTAIVCTNGTPSSHIGIVSREFRLPCVMGTVFDDTEPADGTEVEVDCSDDPGVVRA